MSRSRRAERASIVPALPSDVANEAVNIDRRSDNADDDNDDDVVVDDVANVDVLRASCVDDNNESSNLACDAFEKSRLI